MYDLTIGSNLTNRNNHYYERTDSMLNVKQAHTIAKGMAPNLYLTSILNFEEDFGFLFSTEKNEVMFGASYILINKETKEFALLPTTPDNIQKINSAKKIPLTAII